MDHNAFLALYDNVAKLGFPAFFILGQLRGWWFIKPHVDVLLGRIVELTDEIKVARIAAERATNLAEESHEIAARMLDTVERNGETLIQLQQTVESLRLEVARLSGRQEP